MKHGSLFSGIGGRYDKKRRELTGKKTVNVKRKK
jgi:hypothetical protein